MLIFVCFFSHSAGCYLIMFFLSFPICFRLTSLIREFVLRKKSPLDGSMAPECKSKGEGRERVLVSVAEDLREKNVGQTKFVNAWKQLPVKPN